MCGVRLARGDRCGGGSRNELCTAALDGQGGKMSRRFYPAARLVRSEYGRVVVSLFARRVLVEENRVRDAVPQSLR